MKHDVTTIPYHIRPGGDVAIIGPGGGRDVLSALWGRSRHVTAVELNRIIIDLVTQRFASFSGLANRSDVTWVHDEARSYLTHRPGAFDIVQMSLVDTWAATGAGAFSLSENGLYTREGWNALLGALKPGGLLSVSRWYERDHPAETFRLMALAVRSLLDRGVRAPADHLVALTAGRLVTLLVCTAPFEDATLDKIRQTAAAYGFGILVTPREPSSHAQLRQILESRDAVALANAIRHDWLDLEPPSDERPYFFNIIRAGAVLRAGVSWKSGTVSGGNVIAMAVLIALGGVSVLLVIGIIVVPLWRAGLPDMDRPTLARALAWFGAIGLGFMFVQIPLIQRFSVYLGHPVYAIAVILFSMICFAGLGSAVSDRIPIERRKAWLYVVPGAIIALIVVEAALAQSVIESTIALPLATRGLVAVAFTAPMAALLGLCFPIGMRLVGRISEVATAWMWGMNGACGVLASVTAVGLSIYVGIRASLYLAAAAYGVLIFVGPGLWRRGQR